MEMNFNGEGSGAEAREFVNFSIREYVAEVRRTDWRKCWPFHSFGRSKKAASICRVDVAPPLELPESTSSSGQTSPINIDNSVPQNTEAPNSPDIQAPNAQQAQDESHEATAPTEVDEAMTETTNGQFSHPMTEATVPIEVHENMAETANGQSSEQNNSVSVAKRPMAAIKDKSRKKPKKYVNLSGLLKDLHGPIVDFHVKCDTWTAKNVNTNFTAEEEDDDDVPLRSNMQKMSDLKSWSNKRKRSVLQIREFPSRISHENNGASSSRSKRTRKNNPSSSESDSGDQEREAAMLLFNFFRALAEPENRSRLAEEMASPQTRPSSSPMPQDDQSADSGQSQPSPKVNTTAQEPVVAADRHHILSTEELSQALLSLQRGDQRGVENREKSCTPLTGTRGGTDGSMAESQHHVEVNVINGGGLDGDAGRRLENAKCSLNMNPADLPDDEDEFRREG